MILFKKAIVLIVILLITHTALAFNSLNEGLPGSYRSMNFEVYAPDKDKAKKVCLISEKYYKELLKRLRYGGMLDKKCRIYVYSDQKNYLTSLQAAGINVPDWSAGCHLPRRYYSYGYPVVCGYVDSYFISAILPHELTHAIFAEFVYGSMIEEKRVRPMPLWIDEGMAVYMQKKSNYKYVCKNALKEDTFMSLVELINMSNYPSADNELSLFYAQSPSLVEYLIDTYGGSKFLSLSKKSVFKKENMQDLLKSVYHAKIKNIDELENDWINYIKENY
ncbi:MAG: peptidase MA family metallohydrolase [Candidatus Kappaea frigidicola]|nr:peptidase MA family metallohydrolase [Candidatus Kappaea frigidicola]